MNEESRKSKEKVETSYYEKEKCILYMRSLNEK